MDIRDKAHYPALEPFDIVINNAGVQNEEDIDINLKGTIAITETYAIHPGIRAVLMIGSASGHNGSEFPEYVVSSPTPRTSPSGSPNTVPPATAWISAAS